METSSLPAAGGRKQKKRKREKSGNPALEVRKKDRKRHFDSGASLRGEYPVQAASGADDQEGVGAPEAEEGAGKYVRRGPSREDPLMESEGVFEMGKARRQRDRHHSKKRRKEKGRKEKASKEEPREQEVGVSDARPAEPLESSPGAEERQSAGTPADEVAHGAFKGRDPRNKGPLEKSAAADKFEKRTTKIAGTRDSAPVDKEEGPNDKLLKQRRNGKEKLDRVQSEQAATACKDLERRSSAKGRAGGVPAEGQQRSASKGSTGKGTASSKPDSRAGPSGRKETREATGPSTEKGTAIGSDALAARKGAARERRKSAERGKRTAEAADAPKSPRRNPPRNAAEAARRLAERESLEGRERTAKKTAQATGQDRRRASGRSVETSGKDGSKGRGKRTGLDKEGAGRKEGLRTEKEEAAGLEDENEDEAEENTNGDEFDETSDSEENEENERSEEDFEDEDDQEGDEDADELDGDEDEDAALEGGEDEAREEKKPKTRIFEVVHWALRSLMKMSICTLIEGVGIWELQESGAHLILAGQKLTAAGGQSSRLLQGSDVFHMNAPLSGTEEQMERDGRPEWQIRSKEQRDGIRGYLKTVDHVTKTAKWTDKLLGWDHVALAPLRKKVFGGLVILPGPDKQALVLDLRGNQPGAFELPAGTKYERLMELQRIAMPAADGEEGGEHHPRQDLAFVFEVKGAGKQFEVQDFATKLAVDKGAEPFRELLRRLGLNVEIQVFLLKWLALVLRRELVPSLMVQSSILSRLLLHTFIPPAAICTVKMHEALPANSPSALAYLAIKCNDIGPTLATTNPLCGLIEQREEKALMFERGEVASPPPPLLLDCAPGHIPVLGAGAQVAACKVRVVMSDIKLAEVRQVLDDWEDPAYRRSVQRASVFAAVQGALLLTRDGDRLLHRSSPLLLSELGRTNAKVEKPLVKSKKDNTAKILQATLEGVEHAAVAAYDPDDKHGVDFRMLCVVALLRSTPKKWKGFEKGMDGWKDAFESAASEAAKLGRPNIARERMFQAAQRGSNLLKRVEALGSCSVFDAVAGPKKRPESSGGSRVVGMQILGDDLASIFSQQVLDRYPTCPIGGCRDSNSAKHLRELCMLKERLARRKLSRESPLAFLLELKDNLEAQHADEFPEVDFVSRGDGERQDAEALEQYVQRLAQQVIKMRKKAADEAAAAAAAAAEA